MERILIAVTAIAYLFFVAIKADRRYRAYDRLPMQMDLTGRATWTAPRRLALLVIPGLAIPVLGFVVMGTFTFEPRQGQEGLEIPVVALMAMAFVLSQALHLWIIHRMLPPE